MSRFAHARRGGWLIPPFLISATALLIAGCGGGGNNATAGTTAASPQPAKPVGAPGATVRFLTPRAGSTVTGSTVRVRVRVTGFTLAPRDVGKPARQGFGHLHFSLDGGRYDTPRYSGANGAQAAKLGVQGKYSPSVTPTITYRRVRPGRHTLVVYLANNDHSLTGVTARVTFTVRKPPPPPPPVATTPAQTDTNAAPPTDTQAAPSSTPAPQSTPKPMPTPPASNGGGSGIPQGGGGDGDADNSGGPDDGDGNQ